MIVFPHHIFLAPPLHGALGWYDEFACLALIALVIVIATFLVRSSGHDDGAAGPDTKASHTSGK